MSARPHSAAYRAGKFLRRHRAAVALAAVVVAGLLVATGFSLLQMREARRQRDIAVQQRQRADMQLEFESLLMSQVSDAPVTMRQILDNARGVVERQYAGKPAILPALLQLAQGYSDLGDIKAQAAILVDAEKVASASGDAAQLAEVRCHMSDNQRNQGRYDEVKVLLDGADSLLRAAPDPNTEAFCLVQRSLLLSEASPDGDPSLRCARRSRYGSDRARRATRDTGRCRRCWQRRCAIAGRSGRR